MSKLVTIFGGSGFVGRYIARHLAKQGWRVRVAVRRPNEAIFVKPYGAPGQVEPFLCNIRNEASIRAALAGADAAVNCVGTMCKGGINGFAALHEAGADSIARLAAEMGIARLVHVSALGADSAAESDYAQSKARGEAAVLAAYPNAVILRPSVIFGNEDKLFNKFAGMAGLLPVLPIAGGKTLFQPVHVEDVAQAAAKAVNGQAAPGIYELGGPEVLSLATMLERMFEIIQRRRLLLNLPRGLMGLPALAFDMAEVLSGRLFRNTLITRDQLRMLASDNVVAPNAKGFADLGLEPTAMEAVLPDYLWRFRPSGQYAAIKASAKNLKKV